MIDGKDKVFIKRFYKLCMFYCSSYKKKLIFINQQIYNLLFLLSKTIISLFFYYDLANFWNEKFQSFIIQIKSNLFIQDIFKPSCKEFPIISVRRLVIKLIVFSLSIHKIIFPFLKQIIFINLHHKKLKCSIFMK